MKLFGNRQGVIFTHRSCSTCSGRGRKKARRTIKSRHRLVLCGRCNGAGWVWYYGHGPAKIACPK